MNRILNLLFDTDSLHRKRLPWVDYAKGVAIILVAYRHVLYGLERSGLGIHPYLMNANVIFYSFRMPLFFILSGIFINKSLARRSVGAFINTKWKILLYPFLLWSIIQITLQIIFSRYANANRNLNSYSEIIMIPNDIDQMWYLLALFNVTILYMLVKVYLRVKPLYQIFIGVVFYYLSSIFTSGPQYDILFYYLFFAIGDFISSKMLNKNNYKNYASAKLFGILLPIFIASQWYFIRHLDIQYHHIFLFAIVALIGCAFMLNICFILQKSGKLKIMRVIGYLSLYIYVVHVIITAALRNFFTKGLGIHNVPILLFIILFFGIALSMIFYNLVMRMGGWFLFTLNKKEDEYPKNERLIQVHFPNFLIKKNSGSAKFREPLKITKDRGLISVEPGNTIRA